MTTAVANTASASVDTVAAILRDGMQHSADRGHLLNEAATLSLLIRPALDALGYPATHRIPEYGEARNRLDEACFLNAVTATPGHAAIIVEAKQRGADFDRTPAGQGRYGSPDRQIQRYLRQHIASGPDTIGALTDGVKWRIYRRTANPVAPDVEFVAEYNFQALAQAGQGALPTLEPTVREQLAALVDRLARANIAYRTVPGALLPPSNPADTLFAAVAENRLRNRSCASCSTNLMPSSSPTCWRMWACRASARMPTTGIGRPMPTPPASPSLPTSPTWPAAAPPSPWCSIAITADKAARDGG